MGTDVRPTFERSLATYRANLPQLLVGDEGKFVVILDDRILGTWPTYTDALNAGYEAFELEPFLVKQVCRDDPVLTFSRPV